MLKGATIISLALAGLMTAASCCCEDSELNTIDGKVESVDLVKSVIVLKGVSTETFTVAQDAKLTKDIYGIKLSDISRGDYLVIGYYVDAAKKKVAKSVTVSYEKGSQSWETPDWEREKKGQAPD